MTTKKIPFNYDINRMLAVDLIAIIHIDDYDTRFLELTMFDDGTPFSVDGCTVTSRFVTISESYLLSDNVPCEATGNTITIPIDAAAVQMMACDIKIEVNIVDGEKNLTLPFPLWVRVRGSILEVAHVTPESRGTIPELLKEAAEELERVQGFITTDDLYEILDSTFQGDPNIVPSLYVAANQSGSYSLVYMDSDDQEHVIFDFSNLPSGSSDYEDLENKPQINGITLSRNKRNSDLGFSNFYYSENNPPIYTSSAVDYQLNDIWINTITNTAFRLGYKSTNDLIWYPLRVKVFLDGGTPPQSERLNNNSLIYNAGDIWIHRTLYNSGSTRPFYGLNGLYICVGSARQSQRPYNQFNITWQRIDNKIQSGVVNSDGTITFANSDGTTFTTTGTSVIGADGFSPIATVTQTQSGATISITDKNGATTANISNGNDYVLTPQDKSDIANIVLSELPTTQGVLYGNTSN